MPQSWAIQRSTWLSAQQERSFEQASTQVHLEIDERRRRGLGGVVGIKILQGQWDLQLPTELQPWPGKRITQPSASLKTP